MRLNAQIVTITCGNCMETRCLKEQPATLLLKAEQPAWT